MSPALLLTNQEDVKPRIKELMDANRKMLRTKSVH
jgi:hypothetical protein